MTNKLNQLVEDAEEKHISILKLHHEQVMNEYSEKMLDALLEQSYKIYKQK